MRFTRKAAEEVWTEGVVDRRGDHISISYGERQKAVALVAPRPGRGFTVQFLLKPRQADARAARMLEAVRAELVFYLLHNIGWDSWHFATYHCSTPANRRSIVHWNWHPKPAARLPRG